MTHEEEEIHVKIDESTQRPSLLQQTEAIVINNINKLKKSQDFIQKCTIAVNIALELYRVITSTLLLLFIPQDCNGTICTINKSLCWSTWQFYNTVLVCNFVTLAIFCNLYIIEIIREIYLINYLDVNVNKPNDDKDVAIALALLPEDKKKKIHRIDIFYQRISYISICAFTCNIIGSGIVVYNYYLNSQTTTTYITYILYMLSKLVSVHTIAYTTKNIF